MTRTLRPGALLAVLLAAACGAACSGPEGSVACASNADCAAGQYCAGTTPRTCWADAEPPAVADITFRCADLPCRRDSTLTVEARVSDAGQLGAVTVGLDLDGGARQVAMAPVGGDLHRATLPLLDWPYLAAQGSVGMVVRAVDAAGNRREVTAPHRPLVTRRVAEVALGAVPTAPAILADGTVVVGGSDGRLRFASPDGLTMVPSSGTFGLSHVHPPVVGQQAIWVAAGSTLYAASATGGTTLNGAGYDTGGAIPAPPAITAATPTASAPEVAFVASASKRLVALKADPASNGFLNYSRQVDAFTAGPVLASDSVPAAITASSTSGDSTGRRFIFDGAFGEGATATVGRVAQAPLALDADGSLWAASSDVADAKLTKTFPDGTAGASIPLGANPGGGPVVLADGSVAISVGATLRRHAADGTAAWPAPAALTGDGLTPIVLVAPGGERTLLVPTRAGTVDAVRAADGVRLWSASLTVNVELREGTVAPSADGRSSVAWFTSADGKLHGLVVDGALDAAAPWPKAWHDRRNSGHLAAPH